MHKESYALMDEMLDRYTHVPPVLTSEGTREGGDQASVLDVGSLDVNGTFRPLVEGRKWRYIGLDIVAGPNVDIVTDDPFGFPLQDERFDIVISGSTMEHVTAFWKWLPELVRVLKPGGLLAIHTHHQMALHRYPVDCWRFLPDGFQFLFDECRQLYSYDIRVANEIDIIASALKRTNHAHP